MHSVYNINLFTKLKLAIMKTLKVGVLTTIMFCVLAFTTPPNINQATYNAYLSGSQNLWIQAVQKARTAHEQSSTDASNFEVLLAEYGLLNSTMRDQDEDLFDEYIKEAIDRGEELVESEYRTADTKAILSALTGLKIAYSPWKGMFLGPKSSNLVMEAMSLDSESPIVQQLYANQQNFTPEMWGGNPDNAIRAYQKAINIYENEDHTNHWMYLDAHAWLGIVYKKQNQTKEADEIWEKAVDIEPDFRWVTNALLPSLEKENN